MPAAAVEQARPPVTPEVKQMLQQYTVEQVDKYNQENGTKIDPDVMLGLIKQESDFDPYRVNPKSGAAGIMQFMPAAATDRGLKASERFDPLKAIPAGIAHFAEGMKVYPNLEDQLKAYNTGIEGLRQIKAGERPESDETKNYPLLIKNHVAKILESRGLPETLSPPGSPTGQEPTTEVLPVANHQDLTNSTGTILGGIGEAGLGGPTTGPVQPDRPDLETSFVQTRDPYEHLWAPLASAERATDWWRENVPQPTLADVVALSFPGTGSFMSTVGSGALAAGALSVQAKIQSEWQKNSNKPFVQALGATIRSFTPDVLFAMGKNALIGGTLAGAMHTGMGLLSGPPGVVGAVDPPRDIPPPDLQGPIPSPDFPPPPMAPEPRTAPVPSVPTEEQVAGVQSHYTQAGEKITAAQRVANATGRSFQPAHLPDDVVESYRALNIPRPDPAEVRSAYTALTESHGQSPINITSLVNTMDDLAGDVSPDLLPYLNTNRLKAIDARPLGTPKSEPDLLGSVGGASPVKSTAEPQMEYYAPLDQAMRAVARVNKVKRAADLKGVGDRGSAGFDASVSSHEMYQSLRSQLNEGDQALFDVATESALHHGRLDRLNKFVNKTLNEDGVPQGALGARALLRRPEYWQARMGNDMYDQALDFYRTLDTLQASPVGTEAVAAITRGTRQYQEQYEKYLAQQAADEAQYGRALSAHDQEITDISNRYASGQAAATAKDAKKLAAYQRAQAEALRTHTKAKTAAEERAKANPPGASPLVKGAVGMVAHGGAMAASALAGSSAAHFIGINPLYGATGGGTLGLGATSLITSRILRRGFEVLAQHPAGSRKFVETVGRLSAVPALGLDLLERDTKRGFEARSETLAPAPDAQFMGPPDLSQMALPPTRGIPAPGVPIPGPTGNR